MTVDQFRELANLITDELAAGTRELLAKTMAPIADRIDRLEKSWQFDRDRTQTRVEKICREHRAHAEQLMRAQGATPDEVTLAMGLMHADHDKFAKALLDELFPNGGH